MNNKIFKGIVTTVIFSLVLAMIVSPSYFGIINNASAASGSDKAGSLNQASLPGAGVISTTQTNSGPSNTIQKSSSVTVSQISTSSSAAPSTQSANKQLPFYKGPSNVGPQTSNQASVNVVPVTVQQSSSPAPLIANQYSGFEGSDYPASCFCTPPDGNLAVGPSHIMQEVNSEGKIWTKAGAPLVTVPMANFFGTGSLFISDPRVVYDAQSGHWFSTTLATDFANPGFVKVAVSQTGDPTGAWWIYTLTFANVIPDQPRLAVTDDKVTVVASDYNAAGTLFTGEEIWVLNKSQMIVGGSTNFIILGPDNTRFHIEPALYPVAGVADEWMVQDGAGGATGAEYLKITGVPGVSAITYTSMFITPIGLTTNPPAAVQPSTATGIETNDARILSASMRGGVIAWTANDGCVPAQGGGAQHACVRWDIATTSGTLLQDLDFGSSQKDMYYPAVSQAAAGDFGLIFDFSSKTEYPSIGFTGQSTGEPYGTVDNPVLVKAGTGPDISGRHGDYHAIRADPSTGLYYSEAEYNTQTPYWNTFISVNSISSGSNSVHTTLLTLNTISAVPWGQPNKVTGKLTDTTAGGVGIGGQPITFTSSVGTVLSTVTLPDGTFTTTGTSPGAPPVVGINVQAFYAGTQFFASSSSLVKSYNTFKHNAAVFLFAPAPISVPWGQTLSLTALLNDTTINRVIPFKPIAFNGSGVPTNPTGVTNRHGYATITITTVNSPGSWPVQASAVTDASYVVSALSAVQPYTTTKHIAALLLWTPLNVTASSPITLGATLVDGSIGGTPLVGKSVTFTGSGVVGSPLGATTNANGDALIQPNAPSGTGTWNVIGGYAGDALYTPSTTISKTYKTS